MEKYVCEQCEFTCETKTMLNTHIIKNHDQKRLGDGEIVTINGKQTMTSPFTRNNILKNYPNNGETMTNALTETVISTNTQKYMMRQTNHIDAIYVNESKIYQEIL